jgi:hypothetical protein
MNVLGEVALGLLIVAGASVAATTKARPHDAPTGWSYSAYCCSGQDCTQIAIKTVTATANGWHVHLEPRDHPMLTQLIDVTVPYDDERIYRSGDEFFHACVLPHQQTLRCLYVPDMGF